MRRIAMSGAARLRARWAIAALSAAWLAATSLAADQPGGKPERTPAELAEEWLTGLTAAKVDETMALSDVPFSWDRKQLIVALPDLKAMYEQVVRKKGARKVPPLEITVLEKAQARDRLPKIYLGKEPGDALVVVRIMIGKEAVDVIVRPGKPAKVVGFSD